MRILLVEDDLHTGELIQRVLRDENIFCDIVTTAEEALQIGLLQDYSLILLDLKLPDHDGHYVLKKLRENGLRAPILILSGLQSVQEKVKTLGFGADDYITKPFATDELTARIRAVTRRVDGHCSAIVRVGDLELNAETHCVKARGEPLALTGKEYQILFLLFAKNGSTVTKNHFLSSLYNGMDEPELKILDVFICKIRKKLYEVLGQEGPSYILTVWGRGYALRKPTTSASNLFDVANTKMTPQVLGNNVIPVTAS